MYDVPVSFPHHTMATDTLESPAQQRAANTDRGTSKRPKNRGNFANDPERARRAGRKGGQARGKSRPMGRE
jgi:general stress protein YciG